MNTLYLFLYFPEDKSEYIPAFFSSMIFLILAILTMRFIIKISKKEQEKAKELEERLKEKE
ncbi:hypothetical protein PY093_21055 [Cytobacillus sp. S13-E01]|uniref:hypothetical protein n=1 Tax=Cytobacillus sp. S13-E01 TaxID=3031326 RepID=UPI0023D854C6|nr:hypothetical protein [Cytobacillus sp. S13-E01]MDF0729099.1 hypothetical protein [Cytobacillus sp. S13-E01]